jgi:osmotically-inducible protein OsmY
MGSDSQLKRHLEEELRWEPSVNEASIGVGVKGAVVTLSGHVASYVEKEAAERAVLRVRGVKALASELDVILPGSYQRTDEDIARAAADALNWNTTLPKDAIKVTASKGFLKLRGTVKWEYQRRIADRTASSLIGVKGVTNEIQVNPPEMPTSEEVKRGIEAALKRNAEVEAQHIYVEAHGSTVVLTGAVDTWRERSAAERAAWGAPGVSKVENKITVGTVASSAFA